MVDAFHPQTILAWAMNDQRLSVGHGAPVRLRVERQLGYKHAKYVMQIDAVASLDGIGSGQGRLLGGCDRLRLVCGHLTVFPSPQSRISSRRMALIDTFFARAFKRGTLTVTYADGSTKSFGTPDPDFPDVAIRFTDARRAGRDRPQPVARRRARRSWTAAW